MRRAVALPVVLLVGMLGIGTINGIDGPSEAVGSPQGRVCVSAEVWSADDAERPCARITRVFEDGSTQVVVTQADGKRLFKSNTGARW